MMMISCHYCNETFEDYKALALHIMSSKKGHRNGKRWASKHIFLHNLSARAKNEKRERVPLTEQEKANRDNLERIISGENEMVLTKCPGCKRTSRQLVPIEYAESQDAWRADNGAIMMNCPVCQERTAGRGLYAFRG